MGANCMLPIGCCKDSNFLFEKTLIPLIYHYVYALPFFIFLLYYKGVVIVLQGLCRFPTLLL